MGLLDKGMGKKYRNEILAPGGTKGAMDCLVSFLGRQPKIEPFLIQKGLL